MDFGASVALLRLRSSEIRRKLPSCRSVGPGERCVLVNSRAGQVSCIWTLRSPSCDMNTGTPRNQAFERNTADIWLTYKLSQASSSSSCSSTVLSTKHIHARYCVHLQTHSTCIYCRLDANVISYVRKGIDNIARGAAMWDTKRWACSSGR